MSGQNENDEHEFISATQAGRVFSRSTETIRNWIAKGLFPGAKRINGRWYVTRASVKELARTKVG